MEIRSELVQILSWEECQVAEQLSKPPFMHESTAHRGCKTAWFCSLGKSCAWENSQDQFHCCHVRISVHLK
jgi:hypothetical protein